MDKNFSKISIFLFLLVIGCLSLQKQFHKGLPKCEKTTYSFSTLSITWLGQYCSQNSCDKNWKTQWDGKSFVIHGYWPASTNLAFLSCQNQNSYDPFCYTSFNFDINSLKKLLNDLNKYWPQIGNIKNFWRYQWNKHGTCYLFLTLQKNNPSKLSNTQIFTKYFQQSIQKFKDLKLNQITKFKFSSKDELGTQIGLYEDQFYTVCGTDNQIDQIRVCYDLASPGQESIISCPSMPKQCKFPAILRNK